MAFGTMTAERTKFRSTPILVIGNSHVVAVHSAMRAIETDRVNIVHLGAELCRDLVDGVGFSPREFVDHAYRDLNPSWVFGMPMGNYYNTFGLVENPVPFDFHAGPDDDSVDRTRTLVPFSMLMEHFKSKHSTLIGLYDRWAGMFRGSKLHHVLSPPPVRDSDRVLRFPGVSERGAAPALLRLKLYKLQCAVITEFCATRGIEVVPVPPDAVDADGFIRNDFIGDPTHGNAAYGRLLIDSMLEKAGV